MKATELMIGDLVQVILTQSHPAETSQNVIEKYTSKKEQIIRCEYVMSNSIAYNKYSENFKINMSIPVVEEDILPIPITPEILEANGFEVEEECEYSKWGLGNRYTLTKYEGLIEVYWRDSCDDEDLIWYAYICGFNACADMTRVNKHIYVHELQHALRLCGLNEIADNFRVV